MQEHINILNTQQFWQRELDKSANQLVFKNLKKTPITTNTHPKDIFISNILTPMSLNSEDEAKATPISVFDANKGKDAANNHLLICTFSSLDAISIIKQNAKKIPKQVKFCSRVPHQYTYTMNNFLRTQGQIRLLKDTNGIALSKSRITTNKGHLILEKSDRIGEDFSRFYPIRSFIPNSPEGIPSITPTPHTKTHTLIQCKWEDPTPQEIQDTIKHHMSAAKFEYAFFNRTGHVLNITTKVADATQTLNHLRLNPNINASDVHSNAF